MDYLYELMDATHDSKDIDQHSRASGHVPIIDVNPRNNKALIAHRKTEALARRCIGHTDPTVERVNGQLKDNTGYRFIRVQGHAKVFCNLIFGILVMTAELLMRLAAPD